MYRLGAGVGEGGGRVAGDDHGLPAGDASVEAVEHVARDDARVSIDEEAEGLVAGELIGSGTVGGGCGVELGKLLKAGDVVELEVEGIGILRNKMGTPAPSGWMPERRIPATQ